MGHGLHGVPSSGWNICAKSTYQEGTPLFIPSERSVSQLYRETRSRRTCGLLGEPNTFSVSLSTSGPTPWRSIGRYCLVEGQIHRERLGRPYFFSISLINSRRNISQSPGTLARALLLRFCTLLLGRQHCPQHPCHRNPRQLPIHRLIRTLVNSPQRPTHALAHRTRRMRLILVHL
jgi:hypothetical protein